MHYVGDDENPFDEEQDKQLPFKDHVNQLPEAGTPPDVHHPVDMLYTARSSELLLPDDNKPSSAYRAVILQPPRAV